MDYPDVTQMKQAGGGVNAPASGTYGEKAALERLTSALPKVDAAAGQAPGNGPGVALTPPMQSGGPSSSSGLPAALLSPTTMPDVPVSTALAPPPVNPVTAAVTGRQQRLAILDRLANDNAVAETTRSWAKLNIERLIAGPT